MDLCSSTTCSQFQNVMGKFPKCIQKLYTADISVLRVSHCWFLKGNDAFHLLFLCDGMEVLQFLLF